MSDALPNEGDVSWSNLKLGYVKMSGVVAKLPTASLTGWLADTFRA